MRREGPVVAPPKSISFPFNLNYFDQGVQFIKALIMPTIEKEL